VIVRVGDFFNKKLHRYLCGLSSMENLRSLSASQLEAADRILQRVLHSLSASQLEAADRILHRVIARGPCPMSVISQRKDELPCGDLVEK